MNRDSGNAMPQVIDTALGLKLVSNKADLAESLLQMLVAELPATKIDILAAHSKKDSAELYNQVHKLHGGCVYCGVPRLQAAAAKLENALRNPSSTPESQADLVKKLAFEIEQVLTCYEQLSQA